MLWLTSLALADIPPTPPTGKAFVRHTVHIKGLEQHNNHVLLMYTEGDEISSYRVFSEEQPSSELSAELLGGLFWLQTREKHVAWSAATRAEITRQRAACAESGEGCSHISRFEPHFAPPVEATRCDLELSLPRTVAEGQPTTQTHTLTLSLNAAGACVLTPEAAPAPAPTPEPTPAAPEVEGEAKSGCTTAGTTSLAAVLLSGLLGLRRRCMS